MPLARAQAQLGGSAADLGVDPVEFADPPQRLFGDRQIRRFENVGELASGAYP